MGGPMRSVIFLGPPGAGKGTQAEALQQQLGFAHVNSGALLREHVRLSTELGNSARCYMNRGLLVPDSIIVDLVLERISECGDTPVVIDGFPKTLAQATVLDDVLFSSADARVLALEFVADFACLHARLTHRAKLHGRDDDTASVIASRLESFGVVPEDLLAHYAKRGALRTVDAADSMPVVTAAIHAHVMEFMHDHDDAQ